MSSYTKQLMQTAADWLRENADPQDPFIRVPAYVRHRQRHEDEDVAVNGAFRKVASLMSTKPAAVEAMNDSLVAMINASDKAAAFRQDVDQTYSEIEDMLNKPTAEGVSKTEVHVEILGRFLLAWARDGYNVFDLSSDFVAAMLLTDSRAIDISRTRLPFEGVLVLLPDGFARDNEGRSYTKVHITEMNERSASMLGAANAIDRELGTLPREQARNVLDAATRNASSTPAWINNSPEKLTMPWQGARLCIHATTGRIGFNFVAKRDGLSWEKIDQSLEGMEHPEDMHVVHTIQMLVFSMLAYINSVKTALEPLDVIGFGKRRRPRERETPKRWSVGRTIKLQPALVHAARQGHHEIAFRLKHRHIVRGHFKQQVHGENRALRKEIYVEAYWKGPEDGAALVHTYKVSKPLEP